jgi:hypothetical protein
MSSVVNGKCHDIKDIIQCKYDYVVIRLPCPPPLSECLLLSSLMPTLLPCELVALLPLILFAALCGAGREVTAPLATLYIEEKSIVQHYSCHCQHVMLHQLLFSQIDCVVLMVFPSIYVDGMVQANVGQKIILTKESQVADLIKSTNNLANTITMLVEPLGPPAVWI